MKKTYTLLDNKEYKVEIELRKTNRFVALGGNILGKHTYTKESLRGLVEDFLSGYLDIDYFVVNPSMAFNDVVDEYLNDDELLFNSAIDCVEYDDCGDVVHTLEYYSFGQNLDTINEHFVPLGEIVDLWNEWHLENGSEYVLNERFNTLDKLLSDLDIGE